MDALFSEVASAVALGLEAIAVLLILIGGTQALVELGRSLVSRAGDVGARRVFLGLARWLLIALEFTLAADIVRSAISPSWEDIGQLAAIALIRTFLNFFLERDLEKMAKGHAKVAAAQGDRA